MRPLALCLAVLLSGAAQARPPEVWGFRDCADASVRARVERIEFESVQSDDPNIVIMDGLFHFKVHVTRVRFGPVAKGDMEILLFAHAPAIHEGRSYDFYLRHRANGDWDIADCTQPSDAR